MWTRLWGTADAGLARLQTCVLVINDAETNSYTLTEIQEAAETILAAKEQSWQKLKRMFTTALAKAAAVRQQAAIMGANPGVLAAAMAAVTAQGVEGLGAGVGAIPGIQMLPAGHGGTGGGRVLGGQPGAAIMGSWWAQSQFCPSAQFNSCNLQTKQYYT
jgi:hypothetical protein